jgi:hypothetical protein
MNIPQLKKVKVSLSASLFLLSSRTTTHHLSDLFLINTSLHAQLHFKPVAFSLPQTQSSHYRKNGLRKRHGPKARDAQALAHPHVLSQRPVLYRWWCSHRHLGQQRRKRPMCLLYQRLQQRHHLCELLSKRRTLGCWNCLYSSRRDL